MSHLVPCRRCAGLNPFSVCVDCSLTREAAKIDWLMNRPDSFKETPEGQNLLGWMQSNPQYDHIFPWLWTQARNQKMGVSPGNGVSKPGQPVPMEHTNMLNSQNILNYWDACQAQYGMRPIFMNYDSPHEFLNDNERYGDPSEYRETHGEPANMQYQHAWDTMKRQPVIEAGGNKFELMKTLHRPNEFNPYDADTLSRWAGFAKDKNHYMRQDAGDINQLSLEAMENLSKKWHHQKTNGTPVHNFNNGWTIRQLGPEDNELEGEEMGHCVAGDHYSQAIKRGRTLIYSLRDKQNRPHATFEIRPQRVTCKECGDFEHDPIHWDTTDANKHEFIHNARPHHGQVVQIQGKSNEPPIEKYQKMLKHFFLTQFDDENRPQWGDMHISEPEQIPGYVGDGGYIAYHPGDYGLEKPNFYTDWDNLVDNSVNHWGDYDREAGYNIAKWALDSGDEAGFHDSLERRENNAIYDIEERAASEAREALEDWEYDNPRPSEDDDRFNTEEGFDDDAFEEAMKEWEDEKDHQEARLTADLEEDLYHSDDNLKLIHNLRDELHEAKGRKRAKEQNEFRSLLERVETPEQARSLYLHYVQGESPYDRLQKTIKLNQFLDDVPKPYRGTGYELLRHQMTENDKSELPPSVSKHHDVVTGRAQVGVIDMERDEWPTLSRESAQSDIGALKLADVNEFVHPDSIAQTQQPHMYRQTNFDDDDWDFGEPDFSVATEARPWSKGDLGKGLIGKDGRLHIWATNDFGEPHHDSYAHENDVPYHTKVDVFPSGACTIMSPDDQNLFGISREEAEAQLAHLAPRHGLKFVKGFMAKITRVAADWNEYVCPDDGTPMVEYRMPLTGGGQSEPMLQCPHCMYVTDYEDASDMHRERYTIPDTWLRDPLEQHFERPSGLKWGDPRNSHHLNKAAGYFDSDLNSTEGDAIRRNQLRQTPGIMYHAAPVGRREAILSEGLSPDAERINQESNHPRGVYLWDDPETAWRYRAQGPNMHMDMDIHAVDTNGLNMIADPWFEEHRQDRAKDFPGAYYVTDPIGPDRLHQFYDDPWSARKQSSTEDLFRDYGEDYGSHMRPEDLPSNQLSGPPITNWKTCLDCGYTFPRDHHTHCPECKSENPDFSPEVSSHPDPWMDNEPGSLTLPDHWSAAFEFPQVFHGTSKPYDGLPAMQPGALGIWTSPDKGEAATYYGDWQSPHRRTIPISLAPHKTLDLRTNEGMNELYGNIGQQESLRRIQGEKAEALRQELLNRGYGSIFIPSRSLVVLDPSLMQGSLDKTPSTSFINSRESLQDLTSLASSGDAPAWEEGDIAKYHQGLVESDRRMPGFVTVHPPEYYAQHRVFTSPDGHQGMSLLDHGDGRLEIAGLYNNDPNNKGAAGALMQHGVKLGGNYVECFGRDKAPFSLPHRYHELTGAYPIGYHPWDDQYAHPQWNYERFGRPGLFEMNIPQGEAWMEPEEFERRLAEFQQRTANATYGDGTPVGGHTEAWDDFEQKVNAQHHEDYLRRLQAGKTSRLEDGTVDPNPTRTRPFIIED